MPDGVVASGGAKKGNLIASFFRILGFICLLFWIQIIFYEIQATEAAMGLAIGHSLLSDLALLGQLWQIATGGMATSDIGPIIIGWITELFVLIFTFAYEVATLLTKKHNSKLTGAFTAVCILALGWDGYTNWTSGYGGPSTEGRIAFTIALAVGAVLLPIGALACLRLAANEG